ncbi:MAG: hypothetical protein R3C11_16325 [Planctomycetaceae bacterium]
MNTESQLAPDFSTNLPDWKLQPLGSEYYLQPYVLSCYVAEQE